MRSYINTPQGLATAIGVAILAASTNANVLQTGGWLSSHALLVASLSAGVFAGARVVGMGAGKIGLVIVSALLAGEAYNLSATAERIVVERENGAAPLKDAAAKHTSAIEKLRQIETGRAGSPRLSLASEQKKTADKAYQKELREGGRCLSICKGLKDDAGKAALEVTAAAQEAQQLHAKAIEAAKTEVAANPLPASATPLADRLGWAPWVLDLIMAALLSVGANGLAGTLIAYGAHSTCKQSLQVAANDTDQTDFSASDFDAAKINALVAGEIPGKPTPPNKPRKRGRKADQNVIDFTQKFREKNGRTPSGSELRRQFPALPISTAYDYANRARVSG